MTRRKIVILGPGKVGTTLGILAARAGWPVAGVGGRSEPKARAVAEGIGPDVASGALDAVAGRGQLVLLTVSDDAIAPVCGQLAQAGAFARGAVVAHCSGAISAEVLAPARDLCGAAIGAMHPLQTFPNVAVGIERFAGTYCFCDGDDEAVAVLTALAEALGARAVRIDSDRKSLYHASAVMACNYLTGLLDASLATADRAGVARADAAAALEPLVRATLENLRALGPPAALTGPIARGDVGLVTRQARDVADADAGLGRIYRALGAWTVGVAVRKGTLDDAKADELRRALAEAGDDRPA